MVYVVKWTENGMNREMKFMLWKTAAIMLNRLIIDCHIYDAKVIRRRY